MDIIKVEICIGTPCYLMGARELIEEMRKVETEHIDKIKLKTAHCIDDCCDKAPVAKVDNQIYEDLTPDKLREIVLKKIK